jgi:NADH-quinone oxidoreductase subunit M
MLSMYGRTFMGAVDKPENRDLEDLKPREIATLLPIVVMIFVIGFFPGFFINKMENSIKKNVLDHRDRIFSSEVK